MKAVLVSYLVAVACSPAFGQVEDSIAQLSSEKTHEVIDACLQLAAAGKFATGAVPALTKTLDHPNYLVRFNAIRALGSIGPEAAGTLPRIHQMVLDEDLATTFGQNTTESIIQALPGFGPDALPILCSVALVGKPGFDKKTIAKYKRLKAVPFKKGYEDFAVRVAACESIGKYRDKTSIPVLLKVFRVAERMPGNIENGFLSNLITIFGDIGEPDPEVIKAIRKYTKVLEIPCDEALRKLSENP